MQLVDIFLFRKGGPAVWCKAVSGTAVSQYRTQQPCGTQRTLDAAAGNVGMALRITLESMDLFQRVLSIQRISHLDLIARQRFQFCIGNAAVFAQKCPEIGLLAKHKLSVLVHQIVLDQKAEKFLLVQKGDFAIAGVVHVLFFGIAAAVANKQRCPYIQSKVKDLQMILLNHNVTPIKIGLE